MMRPRRRLDTAEQEILKEAVRKAHSEEEMKRDAAHDAQVERLLKNLDEFTRGAGNGRPIA